MSLPFSSLRVAGGLVFLAGQGGFDANHELVADGVAPETAQIFQNVRALLESVAASLDDVVSCLVHLADLDDYTAFNEEYAKHFPNEKPV
ncbi:MAG TPA: RidA family protein, partial [Gaiellaceae bacterium]